MSMPQVKPEDLDPRIPVTETSEEVIGDEVLHRFAGHHLRRASGQVQSDLARELKEIDLRLITMSVLAVIVDHPGLRQSQLADALSIERPNLVSILDELESRGLVNRNRVPTDRRAYALTPTRDGVALAEKALRVVEAHEARVFAGLSAAERETLVDLLRRIPAADG